MMKIALFGNYNQHNFGDDLMAVIFSRFLQTCGVTFSVYKLRPEYAAPYDFSVANSLEELLDDKNMLIFGGGGVLCDHWTYGKQYQSDRCELIAMARRKRIPIYGFSLGGNGKFPKPLYPFQRLFLETAKYISVRNAQDLDWLGKLDKPPMMDFFPDVVWQTSLFFPRLRIHSRRIKIGIQIHAKPLIRRQAVYLPFLLAVIARLRENIDFVIIDITGKKQNMARLKKWFGHGPNIEYYSFDKLADDLDVLSSLDLICSTQMHTGVVCMSYGIPFISLFGHPKTKLMLRNLQLFSLYHEHKDIPRLCSLLMSTRKLRHFVNTFEIPTFDHIKGESFGHLEGLKKLSLSEELL